MRNSNELVLSAADASVNQISSIIDINQVAVASVQAVSTGSAAGSLKMEVSNDAQNPTNWSEVTNVAISGAGTYLISKVDQCYKWMRIHYVYTSGTGTISARLNTWGV